jgi:hypothetical protein
LEEANEIAAVEGLVGHWRYYNGCKSSHSCNTCLRRPTALETTFPYMHSLEMLLHILSRLCITEKWLLCTKATNDAIVEES